MVTYDTDMCASVLDHDAVPTVASPLDVVTACLTCGGALGLSMYVVGLLLGDVGVATLGVGVGVVCVVGTLTVRSLRGFVAWVGYPGAERSNT